MRGGRGDQNSEKHLKIYKVVKLLKISFKNIKMQIFRVSLTCDRRYNTFELKNNNKTLY